MYIKQILYLQVSLKEPNRKLSLDLLKMLKMPGIDPKSFWRAWPIISTFQWFAPFGACVLMRFRARKSVLGFVLCINVHWVLSFLFVMILFLWKSLPWLLMTLETLNLKIRGKRNCRVWHSLQNSLSFPENKNLT